MRKRFLLPLGYAALSFTPIFAQTMTVPITSLENRVVTVGQNSIQEPSGSLSLNVALELALKANPDIAAAQRELEAQAGGLRQAKTSPNPSLSTLVEDTHKSTRTSTLQVNQEIEMGGKRAARIEAAEQAYELAAVELKAKRLEIQAGVTAAFFDVLVAQERLRLMDASLNLAQRATQAAAKRVKAGRISPVEETKSRVAESNVRLEFNQAKSALFVARQRLTAFWGQSNSQFESAEGHLETLFALPDLVHLKNRLADSPSLQRAKLEIDRREALVKVESKRRIPNITLTLGAKRVEELGLNQAVLGVSVPIPVFNTNQGNLQEAISRTDKAKEEFEAVRIRQMSELVSAYERLTVSQQEVGLLQRDILPGAQSAYAAATQGFELGKFNFLDVLDAQRTFFQAQLQYTNTLAEAHRALADIYRVLGTDIQPKESTHE